MSSDPVCQVVEVTAETESATSPEIPLHILPAPGHVAIQLRTTIPRIAVGAGLARKLELLREFAEKTGYPVVTSPAGGTVVLTGHGVLGFAAIGIPPQGVAFSIDWLIGELARWFGEALSRDGIGNVSVGRVDGAWCPGFSDIAVAGKKLIGVGFRVTKDWVAARGILSVTPYSASDLQALTICHAALGVELRASAITSLVECAGRDMSVQHTIDTWRSVVS